VNEDIRTNRAWWDESAALHGSDGVFYDIESFLVDVFNWTNLPVTATERRARTDTGRKIRQWSPTGPWNRAKRVQNSPRPRICLLHRSDERRKVAPSSDTKGGADDVDASLAVVHESRRAASF
jgi:hypothetical protein